MTTPTPAGPAVIPVPTGAAPALAATVHKPAASDDIPQAETLDALKSTERDTGGEPVGTANEDGTKGF